jgi:hypothetical protein
VLREDPDGEDKAVCRHLSCGSLAIALFHFPATPRPPMSSPAPSSPRLSPVSETAPKGRANAGGARKKSPVMLQKVAVYEVLQDMKRRVRQTEDVPSDLIETLSGAARTYTNLVVSARLQSQIRIEKRRERAAKKAAKEAAGAPVEAVEATCA